ncbi:surface protein 1 [Xylariaceae sp. FL0255]|nr:surface protein 1 [Xylariaceae sp. FL0255]
MQYRLFLTSIFLAAAAAAPAQSRTLSVSAGQSWTIERLYRVCDNPDTYCTWLFGIDPDTPGVAPTYCIYVVYAENATTPASQSSGGPTACGDYNVTSGWSGQFGPGKGFTTFSIIDYAKKLIAYPSYTDAIVANESLVQPDLSFPVSTLML